MNSDIFMDYAKNRYVLIRVDFPRNRPQADNQRLANQILARKYNVQNFPTVLILEPSGTELKRLSDYNGTNPTQFIHLLGKTSKK